MKKTNPLTQAQMDSQAIIAKNNAAPKAVTEQPKAQAPQTAPKETAKAATNTTQPKPATQATTQ